jgi:hypothetical protein
VHLKRVEEMKDYYPDVTFEDGVFRFDLPNGDEFVIVPPKPRELSDEEIAVIWANFGVPMTGMEFKKVVEAILKKASEK